MLGLYAHCIDKWENRLASQDTDRIARPFEWGLDWLECDIRDGNPLQSVVAYSRKHVVDSSDFYSCPRVQEYSFDGSCLTFKSPVVSRYEENNIVHADFFPSGDGRGRAVLVLPQWNADATGHAGLCRLLARLGISTLRMSMPYHDRRMPAELRRADYHVSSNVGRTIHASRQSVVDARACLDWLEQRGYSRLGILGTSLGSCISYITAAHDPRIQAGVFNHVSMYFGDVVWTGLATRHVREGFGNAITQDELRECWAVISPASFLDRMTGRRLKSLMLSARYDTTFLPEYSRLLIDASLARGHDVTLASLPCAHYTTGQTPFKFLDAFHMCRFLLQHL
jgi:hypothetical protein